MQDVCPSAVGMVCWECCLQGILSTGALECVLKASSSLNPKPIGMWLRVSMAGAACILLASPLPLRLFRGSLLHVGNTVRLSLNVLIWLRAQGLMILVAWP